MDQKEMASSHSSSLPPCLLGSLPIALGLETLYAEELKPNALQHDCSQVAQHITTLKPLTTIRNSVQLDLRENTQQELSWGY